MFPVDHPIGWLKSANLNGDPHVDLVVVLVDALVDESRLHVLLGQGDGTFRLGSYSLVISGVIAVEVVDFNGDGAMDFAVGIAAPL